MWNYRYFCTGILWLLLRCKNIDALECYKCLAITDPADCNNTIVCNVREQCSVTSSVAGSLVGRDITKRQDDQCHECCNSDLCNDILCAYRNPAACIDDETVDCPRMNSVFGICKDIHNAKSLCPKFCQLCDVVDGAWTEWTQWSTCDVTCESGTESRSRTCTNPAPAHGGRDCKGIHTDSKQCQKPLCPVHGGWSEWKEWESCSTTCDVGLQRRERTCTNPSPLRFGDHCYGLNMDDRLCMPGPCANGGWSDWGSWSSCSVTCGEGFHSRSRTCTNPRPSPRGRYCDGNPSEVVVCLNDACKGRNVAFRSKDPVTFDVNSTQTLVFNTTTLNEGNGYDHTTGIFTAPISGTYLFILQLCVKSGYNMFYAFVVNNIDIKRGRFKNKDLNECNTSDLVAVLKSNDQVYVRSYWASVLSRDKHLWNTFSGVLLHT